MSHVSKLRHIILRTSKISCTFLQPSTFKHDNMNQIVFVLCDMNIDTKFQLSLCSNSGYSIVFLIQVYPKYSLLLMRPG